MTANGERYDMYAMTAAHKTLPFGSRLKVVNPQNGKSVLVRINDRGPYIPGRILDLSFAAASRLGMIHQGVTVLEMRVFGPKKEFVALK
ncbi:MAG: septal ring lytic transglycosylase RlpA family protein [Deltaproteobacteria bacterium]|nr:septal ring lytic transglycosylase RlpA family protein [Deltaproteobacteria bacterium]